MIDPKSPNLYVIVEGLFGDHYMPIDKFDPEVYMGLVASYNRAKKLAPWELEEVNRTWMQIVVWDSKSGEESSNLRIVRECLESRGKWVDELPVSVMF